MLLIKLINIEHVALESRARDCRVTPGFDHEEFTTVEVALNIDEGFQDILWIYRKW